MSIEKINLELRSCAHELRTLRGNVSCTRTLTGNVIDKLDEEINLASQDLVCPFMRALMKKMFVLFSAGSGTLEEFKGQLLSIITGGPLIAMESHEKLENLFNQLTEELLARTIKTINWNSPVDPVPLRVPAMLSHYAALRGLRARVREDMAMFVEIYNRSNKLPQVSSDQGNYRRFFEDFAAIDSRMDCNHSDAAKLMLRELGEGVMRRMLIMGSHLLQLLQLWSERDGEKMEERRKSSGCVQNIGVCPSQF